MLFDFLNMMGNYEQRKVARFEKDDLIVDTCAVTDSDQPFETGICHPNYNNGDWVVVELYDTEKEAQEGHDKWIEVMTNSLCKPEDLKDVSTATVVKMRKMLFGK